MTVFIFQFFINNSMFCDIFVRKYDIMSLNVNILMRIFLVVKCKEWYFFSKL